MFHLLSAETYVMSYPRILAVRAPWIRNQEQSTLSPDSTLHPSLKLLYRPEGSPIATTRLGPRIRIPPYSSFP